MYVDRLRSISFARILYRKTEAGNVANGNGSNQETGRRIFVEARYTSDESVSCYVTNQFFFFPFVSKVPIWSCAMKDTS